MVTRRQASSIIAHALNSRLSESPVLLLLSGGSAAAVAAEAVAGVRPHLRHKLFVTLADERYGPRDHPGSNWRKLVQSGLEVSDIPHYVVLWEKSISRETTAMEFESILKRKLNNSHYVMAVLGLGEDGHTAGILPGSPAAGEHHHLVTDYEGGGHQRITITPPFFNHIDTAFIYAEGPSKKPVIDELETADDELEFPAAAISRCARSVVLYNQEKT